MTRSDAFALNGRRVLVTGGSRGLGRAMAVGLADAGATVVTLARSEGEPSHQLLTVRGDVTDLAGLPALVDAAEARTDGLIDSVVHAAGVQHRAPATDLSPDAWDRVVTTNLTAPFMLSQEIGRRQMDRGVAGSHVFIASLTSVLAIPDVTAYAAAKAGVMGVVRNLATEWAPYGIRVNAIGPGYYRTAMTEGLFADEASRERLLARIPQRRFGRPEDLCGPLVFLASGASEYVTGQLLMVDGGWTAA